MLKSLKFLLVMFCIFSKASMAADCVNCVASKSAVPSVTGKSNALELTLEVSKIEQHFGDEQGLYNSTSIYLELSQNPGYKFNEDELSAISDKLKKVCQNEKMAKDKRSQFCTLLFQVNGLMAFKFLEEKSFLSARSRVIKAYQAIDLARKLDPQNKEAPFVLAKTICEIRSQGKDVSDKIQGAVGVNFDTIVPKLKEDMERLSITDNKYYKAL